MAGLEIIDLAKRRRCTATGDDRLVSRRRGQHGSISGRVISRQPLARKEAGQCIPARGHRPVVHELGDPGDVVVVDGVDHERAHSRRDLGIHVVACLCQAPMQHPVGNHPDRFRHLRLKHLHEVGVGHGCHGVVLLERLGQQLVADEQATLEHRDAVFGEGGREDHPVGTRHRQAAPRRRARCCPRLCSQRSHSTCSRCVSRRRP